MVKRGQKYISFVITFVVFSLFSIRGSALTFAEGEGTASTTFSIDVSNAVLQLSVPSDASITLNPTSSSGDFGSTNLNIKVSTNNATGYKLSMSVPTTDLTHSTITGNNAPVIPTLTASISESSFPVNAWGYRVVEGSYNPVLTNNAPSSWEADGPTNETTHTMTLAAKVDGTKAAGDYINTLTFQVVANPNSYRDTIIFDKNNNDATGTMDSQVIYQGTPTTLSRNSYEHPTLVFAGWATTASGIGAGARYYGDGATYTGEEVGENRQVTLYAQWEPVTPDPCGKGACSSPSSSGTTGTTFARAYEIAYTAMHKGMYEEQHEGQGDYALVNSWPPTSEPYKNYDVRFAMQDMTPEICASVTAIHDDYEALDLRDNKLYHITKMADGSCWMTQNLALDLEHDVTILTHADTDLGWTNLDTTATWNPPAVANTIHFTGNTVPGWDYQVYQNPYSASQGDVYYYPENGFYQGYTKYNSLASCMAANHTDCKHYHSGNYYSWVAAAATTDGDSSLYSETIAPNSICPAGWRLPGLINSTSDFNKFAFYEGITTEIGNNQAAINSDAAFEKIVGQPFYATNSGATGGYDYGENVPTFSEGRSHYWTNGGLYSEAAYTIEWAYSQDSGWINGYSWNRYNRNNGINVRCIAR